MDEAQMRALFQTMLADAFKPINEKLTGLDTAVTALKVAPVATPAVVPAVVPAAVPVVVPAAVPATGLTPEQNAQFLDLKRQAEAATKQIEILTNTNKESAERAARAEEKSAIDSAFGSLTTTGLTFVNDAARNTAYGLVAGQVKRNADGVLIAGDNLTPEAFIKDFLPNQHGYLFVAPNRGGSGAGSGTGITGGKVATLEMISPTMSAEDRASVIASMQSAAQNL